MQPTFTSELLTRLAVQMWLLQLTDAVRVTTHVVQVVFDSVWLTLSRNINISDVNQDIFLNTLKNHRKGHT